MPVASAGGGHPERDRDGEVPGRDHRDDAARRVAQLVALAGHLAAAARPARASTRPARVVLQEVDRLADVGVGLGPRLRALADLERGDLAAGARAATRAARDQHLRALRRGRARPRRGAAAAAPARPRPRPACAAAASATTRSGSPGSVDIELVARRARSSPIHTGTRSGSSASRLAQRVARAARGRRAAQLEDRLVGERLHAVPARPRAARPAPRRAPARAGTTRCEVFSSRRRTR